MRLAKNLTIFLLLTEPTRTLGRIFNRGTNATEIFLLAAIASLFQTSIHFWELGKYISLPSSLLASGLLAVLFGWIGIFVFCAVLVFSARLFNSNVGFKRTIVVVAWSILPLIIGVIFYVVALSFVGTDLLRRNTSAVDIQYAKYAIEGIRVFVGIWSLIVLYKGIKLMNGFSAWKAIGTIAVTLCLFIIVPYILFSIFTYNH